MKLNLKETIQTDVLVIGSGGAGLRAAIEAREQGADVVIASASRVGYGSNTTISGGAFAAALTSQNPEDSPAVHLEDTLRGGHFLNRPELASLLAADAPNQTAALARCGVEYIDHSSLPWLAFSCDPGHRYFRDVFGPNVIGTDFSLPLRRHAVKIGVRFLEGVLVTRLLKSGDGVCGALALDSAGGLLLIRAAAIVLASGGSGQLYRHNDNAKGSTGDGYALALDAGAQLQDMEFVQWYPTGLNGGPSSLYYECLFAGTGGRLLNRDGEDIVQKHGLTTTLLITRDRLSLAIAREMADAGNPEEMVTADLSAIPADRLKVLAPVLPKTAVRGAHQFSTAPTVHTQIGGVTINRRTETGVPGLYAAGEVTGGVHGANRLGGNALTETWVFGAAAGREAVAYLRQTSPLPVPDDAIKQEMGRLNEIAARRGQATINDLHAELRDLMGRHAGLIRDEKGLGEGLEKLAALRGRLTEISISDGHELPRALKLENMTRVAETILRSALARQESRGSHYRTDYPETDNANWLAHVTLRQDDDGLRLETEQVTPGVPPD